MAYGSFASAVLHVSTGEFMQTVDATTTAGEVADVLFGLDYAYNIGAVVEIYNQGYSLDMAVFLSLLRNARNSGVYVTNSALRAMIEPNAQLRLESLEITSSFVIKITGIGKLIEAIALVFDPAVRAERRESNRHQAAVNRIEEERLILNLARDRFNTLLMIADDASNFNKRIKEELGKDRAAELQLLVGEAFSQAIYSLRANDIVTLEATSEDGVKRITRDP